jgi:hypothetical protein
MRQIIWAALVLALSGTQALPAQRLSELPRGAQVRFTTRTPPSERSHATFVTEIGDSVMLHRRELGANDMRAIRDLSHVEWLRPAREVDQTDAAVGGVIGLGIAALIVEHNARRTRLPGLFRVLTYPLLGPLGLAAGVGIGSRFSREQPAQWVDVDITF